MEAETWDPDSLFEHIEPGQQDHLGVIWQYIDGRLIKGKMDTCEGMVDVFLDDWIITKANGANIVRSPVDFEREFEPFLLDNHNDNNILIAALKEISKAEGTFSTNQLTHAENVIKNMISIAERTISNYEQNNV